MRQNKLKVGQIGLKKIFNSQFQLKKKNYSKELSSTHQFFRQVAPIEWLPEPYQSQMRELDSSTASSKCS